jgi:hypothetical protein
MNSWVIFNCTNIEFDINAKPGHTHVAVGKSNAEGIYKRMCGEVFVSRVSFGTIFLGCTTINERF